MGKQNDSLIHSVSLILHNIGTYIFIPAMAIVVSMDVILRYVFNSPLLWSQEFNGLCLIIVFFASIPQCWTENKHISMQLFSGQFRGTMLHVSNYIKIVTGLLFFGVLGYQSFKYIPFMIRTEESGEFFTVPFWPVRAFVGVVCVVFCLQLIYQAYSSLFSKSRMGGN